MASSRLFSSAGHQRGSGAGRSRPDKDYPLRCDGLTGHSHKHRRGRQLLQGRQADTIMRHFSTTESSFSPRHGKVGLPLLTGDRAPLGLHDRHSKPSWTHRMRKRSPHPSHRQQSRHPLHLGPTVTNRWLSTRYASASSSFERTRSRSCLGARFRGTRLFRASVCYLW